MGYRYRYSSASNNWGELFGLKPSDLTTEQLEKIETRKLSELITQDSRVERILGDRIIKCTKISDFCDFAYLDEEAFMKSPYLLSQYNECINLNMDLLESSYTLSSKRVEFVWWNRLNTCNKIKELARWVDNKDSVIKPNEINLEWIESHCPYLMGGIVNKCINCDNSVIKNIIPQLPEKYVLLYIDRIFKNSPDCSYYFLSNKHTTRFYIIKILRALAGRKKVPKLNISLDQSMLKELPPVMRLNLLETLLINMKGGSVSFTDIHTKEEFSAILFSTSLVKNNRVERVVNAFKYRCPSI